MGDWALFRFLEPLMPLTLRGSSRIEYLVCGQVLFSEYGTKAALLGVTQLGAKYEMVSLTILCINKNSVEGKAMATHINIGSNFDAFLQEESILEGSTEVAIELIVD